MVDFHVFLGGVIGNVPAPNHKTYPTANLQACCLSYGLSLDQRALKKFAPCGSTDRDHIPHPQSEKGGFAMDGKKKLCQSAKILFLILNVQNFSLLESNSLCPYPCERLDICSRAPQSFQLVGVNPSLGGTGHKQETAPKLRLLWKTCKTPLLSISYQEYQLFILIEWGKIKIYSAFWGKITSYS